METLAVEPGRCAFYAHKNITIGVWTGQADLRSAQATEGVARTMAARYPAGRSYVAFVLDGLPGPTPEATQVLTRVMGQREGLACLAYVLEGEGFWASGLRSMISNTHRESGAEGSLKVGTHADQIVDWLCVHHARKTGVALPPAELRAVLAEARRQGELSGG